METLIFFLLDVLAFLANQYMSAFYKVRFFNTNAYSLHD